MSHSDLSDPTVSHFEEKTLDSRIIYQGKVATLKVDTALHPSGAHVQREVVEHPGGVTVCPILDDGRIVFVEQWRYPLRRTLLELPAGKLDWHEGVPEDPLEAIKRELWEETGYEAKNWQQITTVFTAPGFCNEKLWLFKATDLFNGNKTHQPSEHEWLDVILLTPQEAIDKIRRQDIVDAKTVTLLCMCFPGLL